MDGIVGGEEGTASRGRGGEEEDFFLEWEEVDGIVGGGEGAASRGRGGEEGDFSLDGRNDDDDDEEEEEDAGRVNADAASFAAMEDTWLGLGGIATIVPSSVTVHLCIIRPRWCWCCRWCCRPGDVRGMATAVGAPVMSTSI